MDWTIPQDTDLNRLYEDYIDYCNKEGLKKSMRDFFLYVQERYD